MKLGRRILAVAVVVAVAFLSVACHSSGMCQPIMVNMVAGTLTVDAPSVPCDRGHKQKWRTTEKGKLDIVFKDQKPFKNPACEGRKCKVTIDAPHRPDDLHYNYYAQVTYSDGSVKKTVDPEVVVPGLYPFTPKTHAGKACPVDVCIVFRVVDGDVVADPVEADVSAGSKVEWSAETGIELLSIPFLDPGFNHPTKRDNDKKVDGVTCPSTTKCTLIVGSLTHGFRYLYLGKLKLNGKKVTVDPELVFK